MLTNWTPIVRPPIDGEKVDQQTIGRSLTALQQRTEFLYERLNDFSAQNGKLVIQNAKIESNISVGDWVYFNSSSGKYEKAIAEGELDPVYNSYRATARTFVVGICIHVEFTGNLGSILMSGWIKDITSIGISNVSQMLEDPSVGFSTGRYYLSRKKPGKITKIGGAPLVQLGFLSNKECFISPLQKDIFESHTHYKFKLANKPAASQNTSGTGYVSHTGTNSKTYKYVDYFYSKNLLTTDVLMCIKGNGTTNIYSGSPELRIDIYKDITNKMVRRIVYGTGLDFDLPESTTPSMPTLPLINWPSYGQWVEIDGTGISVSFVKKGVNSLSAYTTTLDNDLSTIPPSATDKFCVFMPQDTIGWTNVNMFDGLYTSSSIYRYIREYDTPLNAVWPPVPTESVSITNNGIGLVSLQDFVCFPQELMWNVALYDATKTYSPWAHDYVARGLYVPDEQYEKNLELFFSKANISTARPIVLTLQSATPAIQVFDCMTGDPGNSGNLSLDLRLDLNLIKGPNAKDCISSIDPVTQKFMLSGLVSKLTAGSGIKITETQTPGVSGNYGELTIETSSTENSGEVSIVSLKNAKESLFNGVTPCVLFLPPGNTKCEIVSKIKIPKQVFPAGAVPKLSISSLVFGSENTSTTQVAVFKSTHFVLRKGSNISNFDDKDGNINAFAVQYWTISISGNTANIIMADQYPSASSLVSFETFSGPTAVPQSLASADLVMGKINGLDNKFIESEDVVLTTIKRVASVSSIFDNYTGDIGFTGINWKLNI